MQSSHFSLDSRSISQPVLNHYTAHLNNSTYRVFSDALAARLENGHTHPDHVMVMNLLIDAALERSGATFYHGAAMRLGATLAAYADSELFALAEAHLSQFNKDAHEILLTAGLCQAMEDLRKAAETAARIASDHHGWQVRAAFWWLSAIAALAQAGYALLSASHNDYIQEKLTASILHLRNGIQEIDHSGRRFAHPVIRWFAHFRVRDLIERER